MSKILRTTTALWKSSKGSDRLAIVILLLWFFIAITSSFIAGNSWSLIPYAYDDILGSGSNFLAPLSKTDGNIHWFGTDSVGRDVAAGMVHGSKVSFLIALITISLSLVIGLFIGMVMGYFGDKNLKMNLAQISWTIFIIFIVTYYKTDILFEGWSWWSAFMTLMCTLFLFGGWYVLAKLPLKKYGTYIDTISILTLSFTMVMLYWVTFARFARGEMIQVKNEDYMTAAKAEGATHWQIIWNHALPNIMGPIMVVIAFSLSGVILLESSLSFLGIGLPLEEVTWGKLLSEARQNSKAWWLAVFPGLAIFALLFAFNTVADMIRDGIKGSK